MNADLKRPTIDDLRDPDKYVKLPDRNVFDAHQEEYYEPVFNDNGQPVIDPETKKQKVRKVDWDIDKQELERIAAINNARNEAGDFSPLSIGHTDPRNPDETAQPEIVGAALDYHVAWDEPHKKWMLRTNYYIRKEDYEKAKTYPYTSIELHPSDKAIHPISLIRRAPQRNLGAWIFSRDGRRAKQAISQFDSATGKHGMVLRYQMVEPHQEESSVTDTNVMPPPEVTPEEQEHQYMRHVAMHHAAIAAHPGHAVFTQKYGGGQHTNGGENPEAPPIGQPNANPSAPPEPPKEPDPIQNAKETPMPKESELKSINTGDHDAADKLRMQREQDAIRFSRVEKELAETKALLAETVQALKTRDQEATLKFARAESENVAKQLIYEGYEIDLAEEVTRMTPMSAEDRQKHADYIRRYHRQTPVAPAPFVGRREPVNGMTSPNDDVAKKTARDAEVLQYMKKHKYRFKNMDEAAAAFDAEKKGVPVSTNGVASKN